MLRNHRSHFIGFLFWCLAIPAGIGLACFETNGTLAASTAQEEEIQPAVEPGSEQGAFDYYKETFDNLGLNLGNLQGQALVDSQNLSLALKFLGYEGLKAEDVEDLPSGDLMKQFPKTVLASAFFAPKITDVSAKPLNIGWRKIVRLLAQDESAAKKKGIAAGYLLFNKFQGADLKKDPFKPREDKSNESKTTQLLLTRAAGAKLKRPVYFAVYGPISEGGKLKTFLTASFDARDPNIVPGGKYFVPQACAECHGASLKKGQVVEEDWNKIKVNYLDTDHWFDRLSDDFEVLKNAPYGVLYDGGKAEGTPQFDAAFAILRRLNDEIKAQNESVEPNPGQPSFQLRAARKWTDLHKASSSHQDYFARVLPSTAGAPWNAEAEPDKDLLPLMNQYCFRCHSSLKFNVFDRPEVVNRKKTINNYLCLSVTSKLHMPQDRKLSPEKRDQIWKLVNQLPGDSTPPCN